jgi:hypothetical protein
MKCQKFILLCALITIPGLAFAEWKYWYDYLGNKHYFDANIGRMGGLKTVWIFTNVNPRFISDEDSIYSHGSSYELKAIDCDQRQWAPMIIKMYRKNNGQGGLHTNSQLGLDFYRNHEEEYFRNFWIKHDGSHEFPKFKELIAQICTQ